jgi:hypothetical protein
MSQNAFCELGILFRSIKKNLQMNNFNKHMFLNYNKKDHIKYKMYIHSKFCFFVRYFVERSNWILFLDFLFSKNKESIKVMFLSDLSEKENLEIFLKGLSVKIVENLSRLFFVKKIYKKENKIFRQKFEIFAKSINESKGDVYLMTRYETKNQFVSNSFFPEIFQIYLEQLRIYVDHRQKRIGKIILNNYIKNFFSDPVLHNFRFCLFEQLLRIFSEAKFEKNKFCKIYLARCFDSIKKGKKFEKNSFETEAMIVFFLIEKDFNLEFNINHKINYMVCLYEKKKVFVELLINFFTCRLIIWSFFRTKIEKELEGKEKNFFQREIILIFSFIRFEIITKNFFLFFKSFNSISSNRLCHLTELDLIDIYTWLRLLKNSSFFKIFTDSIGGNFFFRSNKKN